MDTKNKLFHVVCIVMFTIGAYLTSQGHGMWAEPGTKAGAALCTLALILEALAITGALGSILSKFNKKK